jgi:hypothetical protein
MTRPPKPCPVCRERPVAFTNPRLDFCYQCLPGGPFTAPPCHRCGTTKGYYSQGMCELCHPAAPQHVTSCQHCLAWGVTRHTKRMCWGCVNWRTKNDYGTCSCCGRHVPIDENNCCRLCWRQAVMLNWARTGISLQDANRNGQQLFIANLFSTPLAARGKRTRTAPPQPRPAVEHPRPVDHEQLVLFEVARDLRPGVPLPRPPDPQAVENFTALLLEHAAQRGWSPSTTNKARSGIKGLLGLQDTPGARFKTSLLRDLRTLGRATRLLREFLDGIGFLEDDLAPALELWFTRKVTGLPEPMQAELRVWFDVMFHGHKASAPRSRARTQPTIRARLNAVLPVLQLWARDGHESLREVTKPLVIEAIQAAPEGRPRYERGSGLASIFRVLKGHRIVFRDPTLHVRIGITHPIPEAADYEVIRQALDSPDPTRAALASLLAFHALTSGQLRRLKLTDLRDRRLHVEGRVIPLAEPVRVRLAAYLNHRTATWPNTSNPHVFINMRSALQLNPVGVRWLGLKLGTTARGIRADRIIHEVIATGGDLKRICVLFGLTAEGASVYTAILNHPDLGAEAPRA